MSRVLFACVLSFPATAILAGEPPKQAVYTQALEAQPARFRGQPDPPANPPDASRAALVNDGPQPHWIWGNDQNKTWFLRATFEGGSKSARVVATSDNRMTLWLNGEEVARSEQWETPVEADVQKHVKDGENVLLAEVRNEGGPAGFILKLSLSGKDGKPRFVVSDVSWKAAETKDAAEWAAVTVLHKYGEGPWGGVLTNLSSGGASRGPFEVPAAFHVQRLFTVPKETLGSWVALALDNRGRIIASDEGDKGLCRITPAPVGSDEPTKVEHLDLKLTAAQGLLYAFDSLYVSVNGGPGSGLYRARDTNGDDQYDEVVKLREIPGGGEHGPHSLLLSPDGSAIYIIAGNHTNLPAGFTSRIPPNWNEDLLLPRQWDANGHAVGILAPGGWIARTDPEGKTWDVVSMGYRNPYDMAFNADGELFAYDADMEWDMGAPWYRPTRVVHATVGSEFGWRSGTGKWPTHYIDSLPPAVDVGPGSPVGVTFGYGARFPAKYQKALFILDWTFGTMYAVHLEPDGASYKATKEEFVARTPLPLTDAVIGADGALYFAVGGRGTQSELFRVRYTGDEATDPVEARDAQFAGLRSLRRELEKRQHKSDTPDEVIAFAWPHLGHNDRFIRYTARIAIENQDVATWKDRVFTEPDPERLLNAAVALARQGDKSLQPLLLQSLDRLDYSKLTHLQQLGLLRVWQLVFVRMGPPPADLATGLVQRLDSLYPSESDLHNRELCNLLVYLQSPSVIPKTISLLKEPQEISPEAATDLLARNPGYGGSIREMLANQPDAQKMHYAFALRNMKSGWSLEERKVYFDWIQEASQKKGGASYPGFLRNIDREAFENATEAERLAIEATGARQPYKVPELPKAEGPGRDWTLEDLVGFAPEKFKGRSFENGQKMYAATRCIVCHRFAGDGGATGPDLTQAAGRFNLKDLSEATVDPGKVVSDQYKAHIVVTKGGKTHTGRLLNTTPQAVTLLTDPEDPTKQVTISQDQVDDLQPSQTSLMPKDLLKPLNETEVLDLLAYLLSRGNAGDAMFQK